MGLELMMLEVDFSESGQRLRALSNPVLQFMNSVLAVPRGSPLSPDVAYQKWLTPAVHLLYSELSRLPKSADRIQTPYRESMRRICMKHIDITANQRRRRPRLGVEIKANVQLGCT